MGFSERIDQYHLELNWTELPITPQPWTNSRWAAVVGSDRRCDCHRIQHRDTGRGVKSRLQQKRSGRTSTDGKWMKRIHNTGTGADYRPHLTIVRVPSGLYRLASWCEFTPRSTCSLWLKFTLRPSSASLSVSSQWKANFHCRPPRLQVFIVCLHAVLVLDFPSLESRFSVNFLTLWEQILGRVNTVENA